MGVLTLDAHPATLLLLREIEVESLVTCLFLFSFSLISGVNGMMS